MEKEYAGKSEAPLVKVGKNRRVGVQIAGWLISIICLAFVFKRIEPDKVLASLEGFQWPYLLFGLACLAFDYFLRIVRWSSILRAAGVSINSRVCVAPFLGSIALNNILPLRLGDVVRAFVFPSALGISRSTAAGSLLIERLVDLLSLLVFFCLGLVLVGSGSGLPGWIGNVTVVSISVGSAILLIVLLFSRTAADFLRRKFNKAQGSYGIVINIAINLFDDIADMSRWSVLAKVFILSGLVWAGETGFFFCILKGLGFESSSIWGAMLIMATATLSTLVPSSPGYIGPFHLASYAAVTMLGGTSAQGASFAVISHLGLWLSTTLAGICAIAANPGLFRGVRGRVSPESIFESKQS